MQRLLQLSRADIMELVDLKVDADLLTDAINELRLRDVLPFLLSPIQPLSTLCRISTLQLRILISV